MLSQKEAVYQATMHVLGKSGVEFQDGGNVREVIAENPKMRGQIRDLVFNALQEGKVGFSGTEEQINDDRYLRTYATGLVSNWFRKDRRLNGDEQYRPQFSREDNRRGSGFSSNQNKIDALRRAIEVTDDEELIGRLEAEINVMQESSSRNPGDLFSTDEAFPETAATSRSSGAGDRRAQSRSNSRIVDQEEPPSMGTGHRGAVTDPEHDMRLKRNETPELREARVEAGQKGGNAVLEQRGSEFFSEIGQKGGNSRGGIQVSRTTSGRKMSTDARHH